MNELPLVLIHGYPLDHTMWFSTIASLGARARVICPDLPGFGKEPALEMEPSIDSYAGWLAQLLEMSDAPRAVVAGMSMGGYVAMAFAEKHPEMVAGLGLISTQTGADSPEARSARQQMIERIRGEGPKAAAEAILPKMFSARAAKNPDLTRYVEEGCRRAGEAGLTWALQAMAGRPDRTELVLGLELPVLVVHGAEDKIVPAERARQLAEGCKQPIHVEAPGAGHGTPLEAPDAVAQGLARLMQAAREIPPPK